MPTDIPPPPRQVAFVEYDADGEIVRYGNCPEADLPNQAFTGTVVEGVGSPATHHVVAGALVAYGAAARAAKAARPRPDDRWSNATLSWVDTRTAAEKLQELAQATRARRDRFLATSDFTQLADYPGNKTPWTTYRAALRAITQQPGFPQTISWPVAPSA